jgi:hypothetical protein
VNPTLIVTPWGLVPVDRVVDFARAGEQKARAAVQACPRWRWWKRRQLCASAGRAIALRLQAVEFLRDWEASGA